MPRKRKPVAGQPKDKAIARKVAKVEATLKLALRRAGRLLLIRPVWHDGIPAGYTEITHPFTADILQKALDEGWDVTDLSAEDATRANVESALNEQKRDLIIHCDHGSDLTLCCQNYEAGLDSDNINLASGSIVSTTSCESASGLGPVAIGEGVKAYLGYTDLHVVWSGIYASMFATASYAAHLALLECKTAQEAFDAGWAAYDQLYNDLLAMGGFSANNVAPSALHDRDCFTLLGTSMAVACPSAIHCLIGHPDMHCHVGPDVGLYCTIAHPDMGIHCAIGHPDMVELHCALAAPDMEVHCMIGKPDMALATCAAGPNILDTCAAGPPLVLKEIIEDYPYDLVVVDMDKIPKDMRKPFRQMIDKMRAEG